MKKLFFIFALFNSGFVLASPELKGTPEVIEQYLNALPKIITIQASADKVVSSNKARIKLLVETNAKGLADALQKNYNIRVNVRKKLKEIGIDASSINESKFSSTPEYGIFGDMPKSYNVTNTLSILVNSEVQMISVANISDTNKNVRYLSSRPEMLGQDKSYNELLKKAIQAAKEKAELYQQALNIKLVPVYFDENAMGVTELDKISKRGILKKSSYSSVTSSPGFAANFGETKLSVQIRIKYKVFPSD